MEGRGEVVVRAATSADAATLAALNHHVHDLHVEAEPERYSATDDAVVAARFEAFVADPDTDVILAEVDAEPVGYVVVVGVVQPAHAFAPERRFALIDQISVSPDARRRGVGTLRRGRSTKAWGSQRFKPGSRNASEAVVSKRAGADPRDPIFGNRRVGLDPDRRRPIHRLNSHL